jgi:hypothetical protein
MDSPRLNKYTGETMWTLPGFWFFMIVMGSFCLLALPYRLRERLRRIRHASPKACPLDLLAELRLSRQGPANTLTLAVTNRSKAEVWAEEVQVALAGLEADLQASAASGSAVVQIRQLIAPAETLNVSVIGALYDSAGKPQGAYSFCVSTVLRYRAGQDDAELLEQRLPSYRAMMVALGPISLRRMRWFDGPVPPPDGPRPAHPETRHNQVRRSERVPARVPVAVHGTAPDGSRFVDFTRALVVNAHGCLVQLPAPVRLGDKLVLRNIGNCKELDCQVVYLGEKQDGTARVGLSFSAAAPRFWSLERLPPSWTQFLH